MQLDVARGIVQARSYRLCEGCGSYEPTGDCHHRRARGSGGVHRAAADLANDPRNMLYLCRVCHAKTEHADSWRECEEMGWRVEHGNRDPFLVPALIHTVNGRAWWLLDENGGYTRVDWSLTKRITWREDDGEA